MTLTSLSNADVLSAITQTIDKAFDGGLFARYIALDTSKAFKKMWHILLQRISSYGTSERVHAVIKPLLVGIPECTCE